MTTNKQKPKNKQHQTTKKYNKQQEKKTHLLLLGGWGATRNVALALSRGGGKGDDLLREVGERAGLEGGLDLVLADAERGLGADGHCCLGRPATGRSVPFAVFAAALVPGRGGVF